jgi:predicted lactoylglutathione lyase
VFSELKETIMKIDPNLVIFYVADAARSTKFYASLLNSQPVESSPTFAMFVLKSGVRLGLWSKHAVEPAVTALGNGGELVLQVPDNSTVDELYALWQQKGATLIQPPTMMEFGYTFTALDPDNHRLRVYVH